MSKLKEVESAIAQNAAEFEKDSPDAFQKMQRVLAALKKSPPGKEQSAEVKKLVGDLVTWQFDAQVTHYRAELEAAQQVPGPAAEKLAFALGQMVAFLTEAKNAGLPPSAAATASLEAWVPKLQKAFDEATAAAIPMRTLDKPIVSASGVALKAVQPPPRAAAGPSHSPKK